MNSKEYKCNICNKFYASYKSLWLHTKKFHKNKEQSAIVNQNNTNNNTNNNNNNNNQNINQNNANNINQNTNNNYQNNTNNNNQNIHQNIHQNTNNNNNNNNNQNNTNNNNNNNQNNTNNNQNNNNNNQNNNNNNIDQNTINKIIKCEFCNKTFLSRFAKSNHKKKACKFNPNNSKYCNSSKLDILEKENSEIKKELNELKELLSKNCKIHPKTLQKINKNLINSNNNTTNNITNNTTNNTNNTINNTIINKTYVNFYEPIDYKILTEREILNILNKPWKSLEESIKTIHFNKKLPEYNNIFITNLKDNTAYIFDGNKFIAVSKSEALNDLITSHMDEIESSASEFENKISNNKFKNLNNFIDTINDNDKKYFHELIKKTYPNYKIYKCDSIKNLIYNNSDPKILEKLKNIDLENKIINNILE